MAASAGMIAVHEISLVGCSGQRGLSAAPSCPLHVCMYSHTRTHTAARHLMAIEHVACRKWTHTAHAGYAVGSAVAFKQAGLPARPVNNGNACAGPAAGLRCIVHAADVAELHGALRRRKALKHCDVSHPSACGVCLGLHAGVVTGALCYQ